MEETSSHEEEIIELTEIVTYGKEDPTISDPAVDNLQDLSDKKGLKDSTHITPLTVDKIPEDLLESVLEKWVEKEFHGKVEPLLQKVIERVIEREMRRIGQNIEKTMDKIQMVSEEKS